MARHVDVDLDRDRHAVQGADGGAGGQRAVGRSRSGQRLLRQHLDQRVDARIHLGNAIKHAARRLDSADLTRADGLRQFNSAHAPGGLCHADISFGLRKRCTNRLQKAAPVGRMASLKS